MKRSVYGDGNRWICLGFAANRPNRAAPIRAQSQAVGPKRLTDSIQPRFLWSEDRIVAHHARVRVVAPPTWLIGIVVGIAALNVLGWDFALFASGGGIAFAAIGAFWIASGVAAVIDPTHAGRNAAIIATAIVASVMLYLGAISSRPAPSGTSRGGPNVLPPTAAVP